jgi:hypothetical protein
MSLTRKLLCCLVGLAVAAFALTASATGFPKPFSLQVSVPPNQTTAPFIVQAQITNESILPFQSLNLFVVSGATIVGVSKEVDTFALLPHFSLPLPPFAKLAFTGSSISITKDPMLWGETLTLTIQVNSCGDAQWSAAAWGGLLLNGDSFTLDLAHSALTTSIPCGPPLAAGAEFIVPDYLDPNCITGMRGYYDKDGSIPTGTLPYFVTNTLAAANDLHFRWPDFQAGGDPLATFEYTVCAQGPVPEVPNTQVAWLNTDGTPASTSGAPPAFIAAQACLLPDVLPAPYGTLTASLGPTASYIPIDTTTPPPQSTPGTPPGSIPYPGSAPTSPMAPGTPFDVVIGTERITVELVCLDNDNDPTDTDDCTETNEGEGTALKVVQRAVGGTTTPPAPQPAGALVMSTPLPLLPSDSVSCFNTAGMPLPAASCPYTPGHQALMCVADRFPEGDGHATTFIDIGGDGWGSHP